MPDKHHQPKPLSKQALDALPEIIDWMHAQGLANYHGRGRESLGTAAVILERDALGREFGS